MKQAFIKKKFQAKTLAVIEQANKIIDEYQKQGFTLTLRQLYYQFVARDLIENTSQSYNRIGSIINDARLTGHIDWEAIEDRTRELSENLRLRNPRHGLELLKDHWYGIDMWDNQERRVEVWIEKEALVGVIASVCDELDVPYFACRGYVSQSELWRAYRRHNCQQPTTVLHLGDHDPSGIDMTRDNQDRLSMYLDDPNAEHTHVYRIALNMDQIEEYKPPPNFAKESDSRFRQYKRLYGKDSWELDALEPTVLVALIRRHVDALRDINAWVQREKQLAVDLATLNDFIQRL